MDDGDVLKYAFFGLIILVVLIVVYYYLARWVFSIKRQLWNQQQQINLLIRIAQKLGVSENDDQIADIRERNNVEVIE
jgi:hypothetical protein